MTTTITIMRFFFDEIFVILFEPISVKGKRKVVDAVIGCRAETYVGDIHDAQVVLDRLQKRHERLKRMPS